MKLGTQSQIPSIFHLNMKTIKKDLSGTDQKQNNKTAATVSTKFRSSRHKVLHRKKLKLADCHRVLQLTFDIYPSSHFTHASQVGLKPLKRLSRPINVILLSCYEWVGGGGREREMGLCGSLFPSASSLSSPQMFLGIQALSKNWAFLPPISRKSHHILR